MSWHPPSEAEILRTVDATWPAERYQECGPFLLRSSHGGGQRVSAASANGLANFRQIRAAENAMRAMDQTQLFMIASKDEALDRALAAHNYYIQDPVTMFAAPVEAVARHEPKGLVAIRSDSALGVIKETWAACGVGKGRLAIMARCRMPKTYLLCRDQDRVVGAAYVSVSGKLAMLHALEIQPASRRRGLSRAMTTAAAAWAAEHGAKTFTLVAVSENAAACGLYQQLGMQSVGGYHYRKKRIDHGKPHRA